MFGERFVKRDQAGDDGGSGGGAGGDDGGKPEVTLESLQADVAKLTEANEKLTSHNEQLFGETKAAKIARTKAEDEVKAEAKRKATAENNFEELYTSECLVSEGLRGELGDTRSGIANKDRAAAAMKMATGLSEGVNVELLGEQIQKRLKTEDGKLMVTDKAGNLSSMTLDDLSKEIAGDKRFASLIKGNQSGGGGATDQMGQSGGAAKEITRAEFDNKAPAERMKYIKAGGKVVDG